MNERPILMNAFSVKAILNGRKTQTRRVIKPQPVLGQPWKNWTVDPEYMDLPRAYCPYGIPGDRLWVRETWNGEEMGKTPRAVVYRADVGDDWFQCPCGCGSRQQVTRWSPSIFMPRWASRILLDISRVRVERVRDISYEDIDAEGTPPVPGQISYRNDYYQRLKDFEHLWDSLYAKRGFGWAINPWVWVIEWPQYTKADCET